MDCHTRVGAGNECIATAHSTMTTWTGSKEFTWVQKNAWFVSFIPYLLLTLFRITSYLHSLLRAVSLTTETKKKPLLPVEAHIFALKFALLRKRVYKKVNCKLRHFSQQSVSGWHYKHRHLQRVNKMPVLSRKTVKKYKFSADLGDYTCIFLVKNSFRRKSLHVKSRVSDWLVMTCWN